MTINLNIKPRFVAKVLFAIALLIPLVSLATEYLVEVILAPETETIRVMLLDLFSVNLEESIPTWYSVIILFIASMLFALIALAKYQANEGDKHYWLSLSMLFAYLSMDEGAAIHEIFADPMQMAFNTSGFFAFGWQLIAFPLVAVLGLIYLRFILNLPTPTRNLFILSGALYVGGALIVEGFSAALWDANDGISMTYLAVATVEEFFEIAGVSLLIYTLCDYLVKQDYSFDIGFVHAHPSPRKSQEAVSSTGSVTGNMGLSLPIMLALAVLIVTNIGTVLWALNGTTTSQALPAGTVAVTVPFYYPVQEDLEAANITILDVPDVFTLNSDLSRRIARDLLATHEQVTVVALPSESKSILFAGDDIPLTQESIADLLHDSGHIEFVIYETDAVTVFVSTLAP